MANVKPGFYMIARITGVAAIHSVPCHMCFPLIRLIAQFFFVVNFENGKSRGE